MSLAISDDDPLFMVDVPLKPNENDTDTDTDTCLQTEEHPLATTTTESAAVAADTASPVTTNNAASADETPPTNTPLPEPQADRTATVTPTPTVTPTVTPTPTPSNPKSSSEKPEFSINSLPRSTRWRIYFNLLTVPDMARLEVATASEGNNVHNTPPVNWHRIVMEHNAGLIDTQHKRYLELCDKYTPSVVEPATVTPTSTNSDTRASPSMEKQAAKDDPLTGFLADTANNTNTHETTDGTTTTTTNTDEKQKWDDFYSSRQIMDIIEKDLIRLPSHLVMIGLKPPQRHPDGTTVTDEYNDTDATNTNEGDAEDAGTRKQQHEERIVAETKHRNRIALLTKLLFLYSQTHPKLGYRQGMHEVLGHVLAVLDVDSLGKECDEPIEWDEADAYTLFASVMLHLAPAYHDMDTRGSISEGSMGGDDTGSGMKNISMPNESGRRILQILKAAGVVEQQQSAAALKGKQPTQQTHRLQTNTERQNKKLVLYNYLRQVDEVLSVPPQLYCLKWLRLMFGREIVIETSTQTSKHGNTNPLLTSDELLSHDTQLVEGVLILWDFFFSNLYVAPTKDKKTTTTTTVAKKQRTLSLAHMLECAAAAMILTQVPTIMKLFNESDDTYTSTSNHNGTTHDPEQSFYDIDDADPDITKLNILCQAIMNPPPFTTLHEVHQLIRGAADLLRLMRTLRKRRKLLQQAATAAKSQEQKQLQAIANASARSGVQATLVNLPRKAGLHLPWNREEPPDTGHPHSNSNTKDITAAFSRFSVGVKVGFQGALAKVDTLIETAANVNQNGNNPHPNQQQQQQQPYSYSSRSQTAAAARQPAKKFGTQPNRILKPLLRKPNNDSADKRRTASRQTLTKAHSVTVNVRVDTIANLSNRLHHCETLLSQSSRSTTKSNTDPLRETDHEQLVKRVLVQMEGVRLELDRLASGDDTDTPASRSTAIEHPLG